MSTQQVTRPDVPAERLRIVRTMGADLWVGAGILAALAGARLMLHVL